MFILDTYAVQTMQTLRDPAAPLTCIWSHDPHKRLAGVWCRSANLSS